MGDSLHADVVLPPLRERVQDIGPRAARPCSPSLSKERKMSANLGEVVLLHITPEQKPRVGIVVDVAVIA